MKKVRKTFDLPAWQIEGLDMYAKLLSVPKSRTDLIVQALDEFMVKHCPDVKQVIIEEVNSGNSSKEGS